MEGELGDRKDWGWVSEVLLPFVAVMSMMFLRLLEHAIRVWIDVILVWLPISWNYNWDNIPLLLDSDLVLDWMLVPLKNKWWYFVFHQNGWSICFPSSPCFSSSKVCLFINKMNGINKPYTLQNAFGLQLGIISVLYRNSSFLGVGVFQALLEFEQLSTFLIL